MRMRITAIAIAVAAFGALAMSGPASAQGASNSELARADCREERRTDTAEFVARYDGKGKAAMRRCVRDERREAKADCREDRREEPREFRVEYGGTDRQAIRRCMADELR